ncbi:hypothetical protein CBI38_34840 (plasmid) [Rhodococcus oxybenzonivorans]|uniref:Uncharacterized protein n=1 Tax=Rhodococcus oxybenzonivorans TaxID=1990687 RepID=A0A2S2C6P2_9NOCA|nr:hypothetical protein [Rhodococcus oxybenzonivorans]AWK76546.1 hypothetical protein CBI38_34840 [Rhodococcus oxybenzonivorans]
MTDTGCSTVPSTRQVRTTGLDTLAQIRLFLTAEVVPVVPAELVGEVRAVVKLLRTVEIELSCRHELLRAEVDELLISSAAAVALVPEESLAGELAELRRRADSGSDRHTNVEQLHHDVTALSAQVLTSLQGKLDKPGAAAVLDELYAALGRHAEARVGWQAVFPVTAATPSTEGTTP